MSTDSRRRMGALTALVLGLFVGLTLLPIPITGPVGRYIGRYRATGSVSPEKFGGYKDYALAKYAERIIRWIRKQPDLTVLELQARPFCVFALDGIDSPRSSEQVRLMHGVSRLIASLAIKAIAGRR